MTLRRLRQFVRSYTGRLLLGTLAVHAVLAPLLHAGILHIAASGDMERFVKDAHARSDLVSRMLHQLPDSGRIEQWVDDLVLSEQVAYADYVSAAGDVTASAFNAREAVFQEDMAFGEHGDHMYYVSIPLRVGSAAALRIGFDEAEVDKHIRDSYGQSLLFTGGYVLLTLAIIAFVGHLLTRSVRQLRDISRRIASGQIDEQMAIDTSVSEISDLAQDLECMRRTMLSREHDIALREARQRSVLE
ncbi:MAG: HAMP domain-containing protein, partial [Rhodocyclales bacterium]|nr:HAMP domain-containing protein [Rhodocyclales bacterium]